MKYLSVVVSISLALIAGVLGYGKLQANQANNKEKIEEVKKEITKVEDKVEITKDKVIENDKIDIEQTILIQRTIQLLDKLEGKM